MRIWSSTAACRLDDMSWFAGLLGETLNVEMALHRSFCEGFGVSAAGLEETIAAPSGLKCARRRNLLA